MGSPRGVALRVILRVSEHGAYSNLALAAALRQSSLRDRDRELATELAYGTLRRMRSLDWALGDVVDRPVETMTPRARALVRLGAYQILFTRIPPHAAVGETVALATERERSFVNAVLRRLSAAPPAWPRGPGDADVSVRTSLSTWAVAELRALVGDAAEAAAAALGERAPLCIRTNACRTTPERLQRELSKAGLDVRPGDVGRDTFLVDGAVPERLPGFSRGWFAVQDQASAFVVGALEALPGDRALDACAGPGGKAAHLACVVGSDGTLVASDVSPHRAALVARTLRRMRLGGLVLAQDARLPAVRGGFDRVLVDVPCTGIGSARRRPELLWRPVRDDPSRLGELQLGIAMAAAELVRPGGRLVYSACTYPRPETDAVCDALEQGRPDLEPSPIRGPDGSGPRVRLWPHRHGTDAMFVAAFRRRG